jgi:hypothetical protein
MERIQLAISDTSYATALKEMLVRDGTWEVLCVRAPDPHSGGVMVLDSETLEFLPSPVADPERVVLITRNEPRCLSRAWEKGIVSLVFDNDPLSTAMLAIMAARLRVGKCARSGPALQSQAPPEPGAQASSGGQSKNSPLQPEPQVE